MPPTTTLPEVIDTTPKPATIGNAQVDYMSDPRAGRGINLHGPFAAQLQTLTQVVALVMTRQDAVIRELLSLRARLDALEANRPLVELDIGALQNGDAAATDKGDRGEAAGCDDPI